MSVEWKIDETMRRENSDRWHAYGMGAGGMNHEVDFNDTLMQTEQVLFLLTKTKIKIKIMI